MDDGFSGFVAAVLLVLLVTIVAYVTSVAVQAGTLSDCKRFGASYQNGHRIECKISPKEGEDK